MALLEHDFIIQYKKWSDMPADYISRLPASTSEAIVAAFDPFQTNLPDLQREESYIQNILYYHKNHKWPEHMSKSEANYTDNLLRI